ncbi:hypothetical protein H4S02_004371 [Coemansia sp. RSA 2611]|nr:hypothetical protein LPJ60_005938 [Coemansia sp. RSA 2675]KAJ2385349.1 hypothetical protein H4S02_004371 [Coemansia sp. RSA 2611]KAJ2415812.1 hypothetical protein GGI10_001446 [Coemansia sp. RSA 2530]KAJ2700683.1 hypothetical protein H4218_001881 [Coemansia sp. IMI 209128]
MSTAALQLTKKQRKALQFRGKLDKPEKTPEGEREKQEREAKPKKPKADKKRKAKDAELEETEPKEKKKFERQVNPSGNAVRFIAFVGNVPFKTTAQELQEFLKAANPTSVRLMTDKDTGKSRGFAFVDFASSADLKHALKFHHMPLGTKKINVELTAGGGGNSNVRKEKLQRRREDLDKERRKDGVNKRQKTGPRERDAESGEASESAPPSSSRSEPAPEPAPAKREARVDQGIDDYDDGSSKSKKPNRRKRGRGARK